MSRQLAGGGLGRSLLSIVIGLLLAGAVMLLSGYHPGEAYAALWSGGTGLQSGPANGPNDLALGAFHLSKTQLANSLYYATPLLFAGLSIALGLRAGLFNIGAQGQMIVGALAAAVVGLFKGLPPAVHLPLTLLAGAAAGALWGAIPGLLKAWRGVHEVIVTIMLNFVALNLAEYLTTHNLKDTAANKDRKSVV